MRVVTPWVLRRSLASLGAQQARTLLGLSFFFTLSPHLTLHIELAYARGETGVYLQRSLYNACVAVVAGLVRCKFTLIALTLCLNPPLFSVQNTCLGVITQVYSLRRWGSSSRPFLNPSVMNEIPSVPHKAEVKGRGSAESVWKEDPVELDKP